MCHPIADSPFRSLPGIYHSPINECISLSWIKLQDARKHEYDIEIAIEVGNCGTISVLILILDLCNNTYFSARSTHGKEFASDCGQGERG